MKLYLINSRFYGTQAEAKSALTELGVKHALIGDFETELNTKDDLIAYLNNMLANNSVNDTIFEERTGAAPVAEPERKVGTVPEMAAPYGTDNLDRAIRAIVGDIACIAMQIVFKPTVVRESVRCNSSGANAPSETGAVVKETD